MKRKTVTIGVVTTFALVGVVVAAQVIAREETCQASAIFQRLSQPRDDAVELTNDSLARLPSDARAAFETAQRSGVGSARLSDAGLAELRSAIRTFDSAERKTYAYDGKGYDLTLEIC